jgi:hypothetical protein
MGREQLAELVATLLASLKWATQSSKQKSSIFKFIKKRITESHEKF